MKAAGIARERPPAPAALKGAESAGVLNRPVRIGRKKARPLALRLVAFRKRPASWAKAQLEGNVILGCTAAAAEWLIPVTSLDAKTFSSREIDEHAAVAKTWTRKCAYAGTPPRSRALHGSEGIRG